jgi:hypothetical protein
MVRLQAVPFLSPDLHKKLRECVGSSIIVDMNHKTVALELLCGVSVKCHTQQMLNIHKIMV